MLKDSLEFKMAKFVERRNIECRSLGLSAKSARELVKVAKSLELSFIDFDRISDELMTLTFTPYYVSWASLQILEERFGDSLWNYGFYGNSDCACKLVVTVKPSSFDF